MNPWRANQTHLAPCQGDASPQWDFSKKLPLAPFWENNVAVVKWSSSIQCGRRFRVPPGWFKGKTISRLSSRIKHLFVASPSLWTFFTLSIMTRCLWLTNAEYLSIYTSRGPGLCADTPLVILISKENIRGTLEPRNLLTLARCDAITPYKAASNYRHVFHSFGGQEWQQLTLRWTPASWLPSL